jgi:hypothetical protein
MSGTPHIDELLKRARRLVELLEHPEPGLLSWMQAYAETAKGMMEFWAADAPKRLKAGTPQVLQQECPYCLCHADRTVGVGAKQDRPALPGDLGMCVKCGEFAVYDADLDLVRMDDEFRASLTPAIVKVMEQAKKGWLLAKGLREEKKQ